MFIINIVHHNIATIIRNDDNEKRKSTIRKEHRTET